MYGVYKVHLGPTDSGEYLEVTCRGLPVLTEKFSEHSLADLNEEVYRSGIVDRRVQLPRTLGAIPFELDGSGKRESTGETKMNTI